MLTVGSKHCTYNSNFHSNPMRAGTAIFIFILQMKKLRLGDVMCLKVIQL